LSVLRAFAHVRKVNCSRGEESIPELRDGHARKRLPYQFIGQMEVPVGNSSSKRKGQPTEKKDLVLTPGGWRPKSKTFKVEPGHHVEVQDGRLKVIHTATGKVVADLGEVPKQVVGKVEAGRPMKKARRPKQAE